jgi:type II secretion system protein G
MILRCPYCKQTFDWTRQPVCPQCGKAIRLERSSADRKDKPWRSMRERAGNNSRQGTTKPSVFMIPWLVFSYRSRIFMWVLVALAIVAGKLMLTKVDPGQIRVPNRSQKVRGELRVLRTALEWFRADCKRYPSDAEGLRGLVRDPGVPGWNGYYIDGLPPDLWGSQYQYSCSNGIVRLFSMGPDRKSGTADDVISPEPDYKELLDRVKICDLPRWDTNAVSSPPREAAAAEATGAK